jgi:RNA polymerase sigma factor (TIGR02999 family)
LEGEWGKEHRQIFLQGTCMSVLAPGDATRILDSLGDGDRRSAAELLPVVYHELRSLAGRLMAGRADPQTLQPTALVHEAYLRLLAAEPQKWNDQAHFFRVAAVVMRHVLVDRARSRGRQKRGGGQTVLPLDEAVAVFEERAIDLVALDEALDKLAAIDKRKARVVELRFFGGLNVEETAETLGIAPRTVKSDWQFARLWLLREIGG